MDLFEANVGRLHKLRFPLDLSCTPLGQAQELYAALLERGVESELVVYPREGHGVREREHQLDAWRRTIGWFDRYLGSPR
ncbi:alpha/beta hydrolase family protein [Rhizobium changzhiense]|uniref:alpha/beta hydrolase family protein n=1 Tax=Rhizobium changzhiense TaxID=2692317 RepID=UPI0019D5178E|nr:prolyl oligopeptidase family serine peptidase [Rhizobium changzhiense]